VLEYIHNHPKLNPRTLFATHYHELAELEMLLPRLANMHVEIEENGGELIFKYKISPGVALKSYGVYAARLAGLPKPVIRRAEELLKQYEGETEIDKSGFQASKDDELRRILDEIDIDGLSPVEALMKLYELKSIANRDKKMENKGHIKRLTG
jgi:DNA mismatch repair protein MutS